MPVGGSSRMQNKQIPEKQILIGRGCQPLRHHQKFFIMDLNRCTGCGACMVACTIEKDSKIIENFCGGSGGAVFLKKAPLAAGGNHINRRRVYTFNESHHPEIPLFNLSMACNHCKFPACVSACPAAALAKDPQTGAVTVNPDRCLGCKYCTWACPFDAPQYNTSSRIIEKCDFCIERLKKNEAPACVCSCPTNALRLGDGEADAEPQAIPGFTPGELQPALRFKELRSGRQVPEPSAPPPASTVKDLFEASRKIPPPKITLKSEGALLGFTSIAFILVALLTAAVTTGLAINPWIFLGAGAVAMGLSTVHLGNKHRALYALLNAKNSWLSREILFFSIFLGLSFIYLEFLPGQPLLGWAAVSIGFLALFAVDRIYQVAMQAAPLNFHSAHTLFNGLFLSGILMVNIFLAGLAGIVKLYLYLYRKFHFQRQKKSVRPLVSLLRVGFGFIVPLVIFILNPGSANEMNITGLYGLLVLSVLLGEIIDRTEYYNELDIITPRKQMFTDLERLLKPLA
jgi:Fe-S-cluster-containing dehydrogenase component/DMSO reductase anchor subunit